MIYRTEAGRGGRKGHSNMEHFDVTETVKRVSRKARRLNDKALVREDLNDKEDAR